jgi:hypothetical protein
MKKLRYWIWKNVRRGRPGDGLYRKMRDRLFKGMTRYDGRPYPSAFLVDPGYRRDEGNNEVFIKINQVSREKMDLMDEITEMIIDTLTYGFLSELYKRPFATNFFPRRIR